MPATIAGSAKIVVWYASRDYERVLAMRNSVFYIGSTERSTTLSGTWRLAYSFDSLSRPTSVSSTAEGTSSYTYDATSQVTAVIDRNTSAGPIVKQVNYEYDPYNRLEKTKVSGIKSQH